MSSSTSLETHKCIADGPCTQELFREHQRACHEAGSKHIDPGMVRTIWKSRCAGLRSILPLHTTHVLCLYVEWTLVEYYPTTIPKHSENIIFEAIGSIPALMSRCAPVKKSHPGPVGGCMTCQFLCQKNCEFLSDESTPNHTVSFCCPSPMSTMTTRHIGSPANHTNRSFWILADWLGFPGCPEYHVGSVQKQGLGGL